MRKLKFTDKVNRLNQFSLNREFESELRCFSTYKLHSICVLNNGRAYQLGSTDPNICFNISNFKDEKIEQAGNNFDKEINVVDEKNYKYPILSAVCGYCYSLFLVKGKSMDDQEREAMGDQEKEPSNLLAYYYKTQEYHFDKCKKKTRDYTLFNKKGITEIVVNPKLFYIEDCQPIAIYGGWKISAAINYESDSIIVFQPSPSPQSIVSFPPNQLAENELIDCVACLEDSLLIHTSKKRVFEYKLNQSEDDEAFIPIDIKNVIKISGTYKHCFLITEGNSANETHVYGRGLNDCGQLGLGDITNENKKVETFRLIDTFELDLNEYIVDAYAGFNHSFFKTKEKNFYACGSNSHGQLGLDKKEFKECHIPTKVPNTRGSIAIAGDCCSAFYESDNITFWPNNANGYDVTKKLKKINIKGSEFTEENL